MRDCKDCKHYANGLCHKEQRLIFSTLVIKRQPAAQRRADIPRWVAEQEECGPEGKFFEPLDAQS